ncbi:hypothetical protein MASR1M31_24410 [Porphyromonadaceae bacterium]
MITHAADYFSFIEKTYYIGKERGENINAIMMAITSKIPVHTFPVKEKVSIAGKILGILSTDERKALAIQLLEKDTSLIQFAPWRLFPVCSVAGVNTFSFPVC